MTEKRILVWRCRVADLWADECGWSENASWAREVELRLPDTLSDAAIARRIKRALGIEYMRRDDWCGSDMSWRDGCVGAYADVVDSIAEKVGAE